LPPKLIRVTTSPLALKYLLTGQMNFMKNHGFEVVMISADGPERDSIIKEEECRHVIVPFTRKITPFHDLLCLFKLINILRKEKADIIHSHTPKAGLIAMMAGKFCGIKIRIHTVAGLPLMVEKGIKFRILKLVEKLTYSYATHVWPNSQSLLKYIIKKKLTSEKKLSIILQGTSNGINLLNFNREKLRQEKLKEIKESMNYSDEFTYLLFVGRVVYDKGIPELISVFEKLRKRNSRLKLIIIGRYEKDLDPLPSFTLDKIENNPNIRHIVWTDNVEYYMNIVNFFVFPSHREGFPNVLLQAGAMGLPIVCSNVPGNIDLIDHHKTGFLFECSNENSMMKSLEDAINNPHKANEYSAKLKDQVYDFYDRKSVQQAILKRYCQLLKEKN
jgi:glycosyltransferase involved in cell wall biosynthesis